MSFVIDEFVLYCADGILEGWIGCLLLACSKKCSHLRFSVLSFAPEY